MPENIPPKPGMLPKPPPAFTMKRPPPKKHGEEVLSLIEDIVITLEDGTVARFRPVDELVIPTDPDELRKIALQGPARLAFWSYQVERALRMHRDQGRACRKLESEYRLQYGKFLKGEEERVTDTVLNDRINIEEKIEGRRKELSDVEFQYGMLRALRDAVEHRMFVIRKLLTSDADHRQV